MSEGALLAISALATLHKGVRTVPGKEFNFSFTVIAFTFALAIFAFTLIFIFALTFYP